MTTQLTNWNTRAFHSVSQTNMYMYLCMYIIHVHDAHTFSTHLTYTRTQGTHAFSDRSQWARATWGLGRCRHFSWTLVRYATAALTQFVASRRACTGTVCPQSPTGAASRTCRNTAYDDVNRLGNKSPQENTQQPYIWWEHRLYCVTVT